MKSSGESFMNHRRRYVVVGTGGRCVMYLDALAGLYRQEGELVGLCDLSPTRMAWHNRRLADRFQYPAIPTFAAEAFAQMIRQTGPDTVIVTSIDCTHHHYIIQAMELGCDVICEKPMTTDGPKLQAIFQTIQRTGRKLRVTFNMRYSPAYAKMRELLVQGVIGRPLAADLNWMLDTSHGADYFRRWHREKDKSGGLLIHKSSHHFDLMNWWLGSFPQRVFAMGDLRFYGRKNAEDRGEHYSYSRYTGAPQAVKDPFALFLDQASESSDVFGQSALRGLYLEAEKDSGYIRDRNVFGEPITIEDTMAVTVRYRNGVIFNYSLLAYSPWEGLRVAITGTKGRIELYQKLGSHIIAGQGEKELAAQQAVGQEQSLRLFPMFGVPRDVEIPTAEGSHGGGDPILLQHLFSANPPPDPLGQAASHVEGAAAILVGISANQSMASGLPVDCDSVLKLPSAETSL